MRKREEKIERVTGSVCFYVHVYVRTRVCDVKTDKDRQILSIIFSKTRWYRFEKDYSTSVFEVPSIVCLKNQRNNI